MIITAAPGGPAALVQSVENSLTMAWRGLLRMRRRPEQFGDVLLQPVLFTLMFSYLFGGAIAGGVRSYLPFFIPGILVQSVITTSVVTGVQLREDTAARELTTTGGAGADVWWALLGAVAVVAVFAPLTVRAYLRKV